MVLLRELLSSELEELEELELSDLFREVFCFSFDLCDFRLSDSFLLFLAVSLSGFASFFFSGFLLLMDCFLSDLFVLRLTEFERERWDLDFFLGRSLLVLELCLDFLFLDSSSDRCDFLRLRS